MILFAYTVNIEIFQVFKRIQHFIDDQQNICKCIQFLWLSNVTACFESVNENFDLNFSPKPTGTLLKSIVITCVLKTLILPLALYIYCSPFYPYCFVAAIHFINYSKILSCPSVSLCLCLSVCILCADILIVYLI